MPLIQKGGQNGNGAYTCIGLIEAAAETVGHNLGLGFIPNQFETIDVGIKLSLLIPDWLEYWVKKDQDSEGLVNYMIGALDPVDFLITDPLGRRLGHIDGQTYNEIPEAYYNGNGNAEIFLIPKLEDGIYQFKFKGLGEETVSGIKSVYNGVINEILINKQLNRDEVILKTFDVSQKQIFSPLEIIQRLDKSIVNGNYEAKIQAFTAIAKNIEKQIARNHIATAKILGKVLALELKLFLKSSIPARGLSEQQALHHLNSYLDNLN
jgi:hypothetical protein